MKKIFLISLFLLACSAFAETTTNSIRTSDGQLVHLNDSESVIFEKLGKAQPKYYVYQDHILYCAAKEYVYQVDMQEYRIVVCRGLIVRIFSRNI